MNNNIIISRVEHISQQIDILTTKGILGECQIAIYGFDLFSQALQSLLTNRKMSADYYLSYDLEAVAAYKRRMKGIAARYIKDPAAIIGAEIPSDVNAKEMILLIASDISVEEEKKLAEDGFLLEKNCFKLYDWRIDNFKKEMEGKKPLGLRDIQLLEKDILKDFDSFCRENNLRYWVSGGTLIGAMRHKGFIPWDDDIDLFMPWEDYKKLMKIYKSDKYAMISLEHDEDRDNYTDIWSKLVEKTTIIREDALLYTKIHSAWIDIFPIIGMPNTEKERELLQKEVIEAERKFLECFYRGNGNIRKRNEAYKLFQEMNSRYDFETSELVGVIGSAYREKDIYHRAIFNETLRVPFEDIEVNIPVGYEEYLNNMYGPTWNQMPDESKRQSHHELEAYWL